MNLQTFLPQSTSFPLNAFLLFVLKKIPPNPEESFEAYTYRLCQHIAQQSGPQATLSPTTLKRLWGRTTYQYKRQPSTLRYLLHHFGFLSLQDFEQQLYRAHYFYQLRQNRPLPQLPPLAASASQLPQQPIPLLAELILHPGFQISTLQQSLLPYRKKPTRNRQLLFWLAASTLLLTALATFWWSNQNHQNPPPKSEPATFSQAQLDGVVFQIDTIWGATPPTSVIVRYDFSSLGIDSAQLHFGEFQGDPNIVTLDSSRGTYDYSYWKPSVAEIKLMAAGQELKAIPVQIPSDGWTAWWYGMDNNQDRYIHISEPPCSFISNSQMYMDRQAVATRYQHYYVTNFRKIHNFGWNLDTLDIRMRAKSDPQQGAISCFSLKITLINQSTFIGDLIFIREGCGSFAQFHFADYEIKEQNPTDIHRFEQPVTDWSIVRFRTLNGTVEAYLNGKKIYTAHYTEDPGQLWGLHTSGKGSFPVDWIEVRGSQSGKILYRDDFEQCPAENP